MHSFHEMGHKLELIAIISVFIGGIIYFLRNLTCLS